MSLRTVFMGSPAFAVPCLEVLSKETQVLCVVCQPDKPAGRGLSTLAPAVKQAAIELGIPVLQPLSVRPQRSNIVEVLKEWAPDLIVVVAYGKILPKEVLEIPRLGCWNVHASMLPFYRGAAPIQWSIIQAEPSIGVTLMQMDEGMDTGPTFLSKSMLIESEDTTLSLSKKLSLLGASLLKEGIDRQRQGTLPAATAQDHPKATMAPLLQKEHGFIDFSRTAALVSGQIRGVDPWPGAYTTLPDFPDAALKLFSPTITEGKGTPGEILGLDPWGLKIACGDQAVSILELQLPGRKRLSADVFLKGHPIKMGTICNRPNKPFLLPTR